MTNSLRRRIAAALVAAALAVAVPPLHAQRLPQRPAREQAAHEQLMSELARLRAAAVLEAAGDLTGAEGVVREVLAANPVSLSALIALERVLGLQGRLPDVLPAVNRLLESDPLSVIGHQTRLRVYATLNDVKNLEHAISAWIRATPALETPYREGAVIWRQRDDHTRAIALLEQGRKQVNRADALALELGDTYAAAGNVAKAVHEWSRAVGSDGAGFLRVQRRVQNLPDGGARVIPALVEALAAEPITSGRQKSATLLAIDAGLESQARRLARDVTAIVRIEERSPLLVEIARRADGAGLHRLAAWAYGEVLRTANPREALALRTRIAELALLAGDTTLAADTYRELELAAAAGSPQRRQAIALRVQLTARDGELLRATADYDLFRVEYPQAPELDATAAALAAQHIDSGDPATAERVLSGITGPRSAQLRGRMALRAGDIERARNELLSAAPLLQGREATETIALAALLMRVSARGGELVVRVMSAHEEERALLIQSAAAEARQLPAAERAAVLDFLAGAADRARLTADAEALRREIVTTLGRTQEAPAALLALARSALARADAAEEARVLLEKLILEYPRSALVPQARSELQRLQTRVTVR
ncbi:MAG TPA: hypothetical protein VMN60_14815 [Longimicrobiales bacterium]|nr:hypothetical protein [Longimicrobiales bacterium]